MLRLGKSRTPLMLVIEKVLLGGRSSFYISEDGTDEPKYKEFKNMLDELDKEWFNFMPTDFFIEKYREEQGEFLDAFKNFIEFKKRLMNDFQNKGLINMVNSLEKAMYGEISDVILAMSSAMFERKVEEEDVINDLKSLILKCEKIAKDIDYEFRIDDMCTNKVFEAHYDKIKEMTFGKRVYTDIVYQNYENPWVIELHKLHTPEELMDPRNKMKIVKEIRRMFYAVSNTNMLNYVNSLGNI